MLDHSFPWVWGMQCNLPSRREVQDELNFPVDCVASISEAGMSEPNAIAAWIAMLAGVISGSACGLFFHRETWLGGYASWPRRMMRLGHIAFFGIAFLNLAYAVSIHTLGWGGLTVASRSLMAANFLMPAACYLAAWQKSMRWLLAVPVGCVVIGLAVTLWLELTK